MSQVSEFIPRAPVARLGSIVCAAFLIAAPLSATGVAGVVTGPRVAIVAAAANTANPQTNTRFTDPRDMLVADGRFSAVDIINTTPFGGGGTPTLATLQQYDAVLTWSNDSHANSETLGDVMADYVDGGGAVVVAVFGNTSANLARQLRGRWLTGGYEVIPQGGGHIEGPVGSTGGQPSGIVKMATPLEPAHPIFDAVVDVNLNWVDPPTSAPFGAHRPNTTLLAPDARKLALWEDGKTAVAISNLNPKRVDLGIHPVSELVNAGYYDLDSDADRMIANALFFAATVPEPASLTGVAGLAVVALRRRSRHAGPVVKS